MLTIWIPTFGLYPFPCLDNLGALCFTNGTDAGFVNVIFVYKGDIKMAVVMKQYRTYKCINCSQKAKTERVTEGYTFGNPFYTCPHCGTLNYDPYITEPALLSPKKTPQRFQKQFEYHVVLAVYALRAFCVFGGFFCVDQFLMGPIDCGAHPRSSDFSDFKKKEKIRYF